MQTKHEWRRCYLCSGGRFISTPEGSLLCPLCRGDGSLFVVKKSAHPFPINLLKDLQNGRIK